MEKRLKYIANVSMGQSPPSTEYSVLPEAGLPFLQGTADFSNEHPDPKVFCGSAAKVALQGDILFSVRAPVGEMNIADQAYGIGRGLCGIRVHDGFHQRFAWWALQAARGKLNVESTGSTYEAVSAEDVANLRVPIPESSVQVGISSYLDRETSRIDALIAAKQRLIELLSEKSRALITQAVTKGLNPNVPMRESGLPWLGDIPKHWQLERAKWYFKERDERTVDDQGELLTVSHITGVTSRAEKEVNMFEAETTEGYKICRKGDLAINTMWAWMGAMGISPLDGIVSPGYNVYSLQNHVYGPYIDLFVRTPLFCAQVIRYSKGVWSSRLRLYPENFFDILIAMPPFEEQVQIAALVASETSKLDALQKETERSIDLSKERRAALIAAAVTGAIDINSFQPSTLSA